MFVFVHAVHARVCLFVCSRCSRTCVFVHARVCLFTQFTHVCVCSRTCVFVHAVHARVCLFTHVCPPFIHSRMRRIGVLSRPSLVLGVLVEISAEELRGCHGCCCFPCGAAVFNIAPKNKDNYIESGLALWFGAIPLPYSKTRKREQGTNTFTNTGDGNDIAAWFSPDKLNFGEAKSIGCGGRLC